MSVDLPKPDSPGGKMSAVREGGRTGNMTTMRTNNHSGELEALPDALPVHLVWQVCEANVAVELFADDGWCGRVCCLGQGRGGGVHLARGAVGGEGVAIGGGDVRVGHLELLRLNTTRGENTVRRIRRTFTLAGRARVRMQPLPLSSCLPLLVPPALGEGDRRFNLGRGSNN